MSATPDAAERRLTVGVNPYGLTYTLGLQGAGTPRANPHATGLDGFLAMATEIGARAVEIHDPWLTDIAPDDIADAVLFLSAEDSRMITKQCLTVDGGAR